MHSFYNETEGFLVILHKILYDKKMLACLEKFSYSEELLNNDNVKIIISYQ